MKKIFVLFISLFSLFSFSQAPQWQWIMPTQTLWGFPAHIIFTDAAGNVYTYGNFNTDFSIADYQLHSADEAVDSYITKLNAQGEVQWIKQFSGLGNNKLLSVDADTEGNLYLLGDYSNGLSLEGTEVLQGFGIFVAKISTDGQLQWIKTGSASLIENLKVAPDGSIYFVVLSTSAFSYEGASFASATTVKPTSFIVKLNATGNLVWCKSFYGNDAEDSQIHVMEMAVDSSNSLILAGDANNTSIMFETNTMTNSYRTGLFLFKINSSGNLLWGNVLGNSNDPQLGAGVYRDVVTDSDNNIYVVGAIMDGVYPDTVNVNPTTNKPFIAKYSPTGQNEWVKKCNYESSGEILSVGFDGSGNIIVSGSSAGAADFGNGIRLNTAQTSSKFIVLYNPQGIAQWITAIEGVPFMLPFVLKTFGQNVIYTASVMIYGTAQYGSFTHTLEGNNGLDVVLGKINYGPLSAPSFNPGVIEVYPNPVTDVLSITSEQPVSSITLIDCNGRIVGQVSDTKQINISALQSGVYFATIKTATGNEMRKIIKK